MTDLISRPLNELCGNCHRTFGKHSYCGSRCPDGEWFSDTQKFRPMTAREQDVLQSIESAPLNNAVAMQEEKQ
jgi:hypothetical protein